MAKVKLTKQAQREVLDGLRKMQTAPPARRVERKRHFVPSGNWPLRSDALGCHPDQIKEFTADAKAAGLTGVSFDADGTCVVSTRRQRAQYAAMRGLHDKDGGYGDG